MPNNLFRRLLVIGILMLFVGTGVLPSISGDYNSKQDFRKLIFYTFEKTGTKECKVELSSDVTDDISARFEELKDKIVSDPFSVETNVMKSDFVDLLDSYGLIPSGLSRDDVFSLLDPGRSGWFGDNIPFSGFRDGVLPVQYSHRGSAFFCSIAGGGAGMLFPPVMFPRPRLAIFWAAYMYYSGTIASNIYTGHGFAAGGPQFGSAVGFWGIGLSFAFPGEPSVFGFAGYALAAWVMAEFVENYPPNQVPVVSEEDPADGSVDVPNSLSELSFRISDGDGDRMSYSVTTSPYIGAGSGSNVVGGTYSIPVSGLNSDTKYSWHVVVSDQEDITERTFSFRTAVEAPYISDPYPMDGDDWVPVDISELSFRLEDFQGDLMDYTVETVPDIGSGSGSGVGNGVYSVPVSGLSQIKEYVWFVNVTDGEFWTRRVFDFKTQPLMVFDPFVEGWLYRKQITINSSQVVGDLSGFPVLVSLVDSDLAAKAQEDGDDVLFMDGSGVANRLFHEIESFDGSSGELVCWVNVSSLSSSVDTVLFLYYGNSSCGSQQYPDRVWDSDFCGVWHLNDFSDSSFNGNDGVNYGTDDCIGKIGEAKDFIRSNSDYISWGDMQEPANGKINTATFEMWVNPDDFDVSNSLINKANTGDYEPDKLSYGFSINGERKIHCALFSGTWYSQGNKIYFITNDPLLVAGGWQHISIVINLLDKSAKIFYNGEEKENTREILGTPPAYFYNINYPEESGRLVWEGATRKYNGAMDELRISKICRSEEWIITQYNNQNNPSIFMSFGPEES